MGVANYDSVRVVFLSSNEWMATSGDRMLINPNDDDHDHLPAVANVKAKRAIK